MYNASLTANDAKRLTSRVKEHRRSVAEKILGNIYRAIAHEAKYGYRYIAYTVPVVTDTVYNTDSVLEIVRETLVMRNFIVVNKENVLLIGWGGGR